MRLGEIVQIVDGTSDPAFAVDGFGEIAAWNQTAAEIFGISSAEAVGRPCHEVICGMDDDGIICSSKCVLHQPTNKDRLMRDFDLRIETPAGRKWFNVSLIFVYSATADRPYTIHIMRSVDMYKRLEVLLRDFVVSETNISREEAIALVSSTRTLARETSLTEREIQILKLVAKGGTSLTIADKLKISPTTVDNHLQHILRKLNAHSRLEAVLRAEHAGLL